MHGPFQLGTGYRFADFTDGLTNAILIGEKHVPMGKEGVGWWDCSTYNGDFHTCSTRAAAVGRRPTTDPKDTGQKFGSRHTGVVQFCFAAGHVRALKVTIDPATFELLGQRSHGQVIPDY